MSKKKLDTEFLPNLNVSDNEEDTNDDLLQELLILTGETQISESLSKENIFLEQKESNLKQKCDSDEEDHDLNKELIALLGDVSNEQDISSKTIKTDSKLNKDINTLENVSINNESLQTNSTLIDETSKIEGLKSKALQAKKSGNIEAAKQYLLEARKLSFTGNDSIKSQPSFQSNTNTTSQTNNSEISIDYNDVFTKSIEYYTKSVITSKEEGDPSKARRNQRILDQFKNAYNMFKNNKEYNYHELVVPLGLPKFPPNIFQSRRDIVSISQNTSSSSHSTISEASSNLAKVSNDEQINSLKKRILAAKKEGNLALAKELFVQLKNSKTGNNVITIPPSSNVSFSPYSLDTFELSTNDLIEALESQMKIINEIPQIKSPVPENLEKFSKSRSDLLTILQEQINFIKLKSKSDSKSIQLCHQKRYIPIIQRNQELDNSTLQVVISDLNNLDLIGVPIDKVINIVVSLPFPKESPQVIESSPSFTLNSLSENIKHSFSFKIDRNNKLLLRQFKRIELKIIIQTPGGFLRKANPLIGGSIKLDKLLTQSTFTENITLNSIKKIKTTANASARVVLKLRDPIYGFDVQSKEMNWLFVLEKNHYQIIRELSFLDISSIKCIELIQFEIKQLMNKLSIMKNVSNQVDCSLAQLIISVLEIKKNSISIVVRNGGSDMVKEYLSSIIAESTCEENKVNFYNSINEKQLSDYHKQRYQSILKEISVWKKNKHSFK